MRKIKAESPRLVVFCLRKRSHPEECNAREPHPFTGAVYEEVGEGMVEVEDAAHGQSGRFKWNGEWIEGELTYADPHMLYLVGGPALPPEKDIWWTVMPPTEDSPAARFQGQFRPRRRRGGAAAAQDHRQICRRSGPADPEGPRSASFLPLEFFLDNDRKPELVPDAFRKSSPMPGGPTKVSTARFFEQKYHDLEVEHIWNKCWQMACREDDIPEVGDYYVYKVASLNYLVVRTAPDEFRAYANSCLHRGRILRERSGKKARSSAAPTTPGRGASTAT